MKKGPAGLKISILIIIAALIAVTGFTINSVAKKAASEDIYKEMELFSDAITFVRSNYVDEIPTKDLIYGALKGMLSSLDAHCQFMDPEAFKEIKVDTSGKFGGLGIEISIKDGLLTIIAPLVDTPAYKAGIKPLDRIVKIDGETTKDITLFDAVKKLRGKAGTPVTVTILREDEKTIFDVEIIRDIIKVESIKNDCILEDNIGYVRVSEFQERTGRDLKGAVKKLEKAGMEGFILDLRSNPGGLLQAAVDVSGIFLSKNDTVVSTKGRDEKLEVVYKVRKGSAADYPMVVLIDGGSASASEIVAGAIQDHKRGIIMGTKSFGKGSVQTVIPLKDDSALRLTTAKYFTPLGRAIRDDGITPDVVVEHRKFADKDDEEKKVEEVFENLDNDKDKPEPEKKEGRPDLTNDNQLLRALDLLKALKTYPKT